MLLNLPATLGNLGSAMETYFDVLKADGTIFKYKGACTGGMLFYAKDEATRAAQYATNREYRLLVRKAPGLSRDIAVNYLKAIEQWGLGTYELDSTWIAKAESTNLIRWYIIFCLLRYLWENAGNVYLWDSWCKEFPEKDKWIMFLMVQRFYAAGDMAGHRLTNIFVTHRSNPKEIADRFLDPIGFDWNKKQKVSVSNLFDGMDKGKKPPPFQYEYYGIKDEAEWHALYKRFEKQPK